MKLISRNARILLAFLPLFLWTVPAHAAARYYVGQIDIQVTSGNSCDGMTGKHDIVLVVSDDAAGASLGGYFSGDKLTIGRFSGKDRSRLDVTYPFVEEHRASGHFLAVERLDDRFIAELRDRHAEADAEDCNFDRARLDLAQVSDGDASAHLRQLTNQYDAYFNRSHGLALSLKSGYREALPYFEKALELADTAYPAGSDQLTSYIIGLATCYIWLERFDSFNQLYDSRIANVTDESVRSVFGGFRVRPLMAAGRTALGREDYDEALKNFEEAYRVQPQNSDAAIAVVSVHLRREQYREALAFLERSRSLLKNENERREVSTAMAMILAKKAQKDDRKGETAEAEASLRRAMELDSSSVQYLIALARLRHKAGSLSDAQSLLDKGDEQFKDAFSQKELKNARDRIMQTEMFLRKIRTAGS